MLLSRLDSSLRRWKTPATLYSGVALAILGRRRAFLTFKQAALMAHVADACGLNALVSQRLAHTLV